MTTKALVLAAGLTLVAAGQDRMPYMKNEPFPTIKKGIMASIDGGECDTAKGKQRSQFYIDEERYDKDGIYPAGYRVTFYTVPGDAFEEGSDVFYMGIVNKKGEVLNWYKDSNGDDNYDKVCTKRKGPAVKALTENQQTTVNLALKIAYKAREGAWSYIPGTLKTKVAVPGIERWTFTGERGDAVTEFGFDVEMHSGIVLEISNLRLYGLALKSSWLKKHNK